jgi:sugar lactone lactonase YvrE
MVGPAVNTVNGTSLGSLDPNPSNDTASSQTIVYDSASCTATPPSILGPQEQANSGDGKVILFWSAVSGASKYRVWSRLEGAQASQLGETNETQLAFIADAGSTEWWVEAVFDTCPPVASPHAHFVSTGQPLQFLVSDYAGRAGVSGHGDGPLATATFASPISLGIDGYGNMYVADMDTSTIRRITQGNVATVAGIAGVTGSNDGTVGYSTLNHPRAIAVSAGGYVSIADTDNHLIRFFFPNGNGVVFGPFLVTLAGSPGVQGTADGMGSSARFSSPEGIAVATNYTLFVGDTKSDRVRQVGQNGVVTSVSASQLHGPTGIALDGQGNIYVADTESNVIRRIGTDGQVESFAGFLGSSGLADGVGAAARFNHPTALAFDHLGNLFVADTGNHAIRRIAPSHFVTTVVGGGILNSPNGIAFDGSGRLFIADTGNNVIRLATARSAPARRRSAHH